MSAPPPRTPSATFQPRFTLSLLYLVVFFLGYSLLLIAPELSQFRAPADPAQEPAAKAEIVETIRRAFAPRLPLAFALAVGTVFLGAWQRLLPGIRPPDPNR